MTQKAFEKPFCTVRTLSHVLALCKHYKKTIYDYILQCDWVPLYSVVGQSSYTLFTRLSPVFHGRGWLTRLNMTYTLWKQARLTIPKGCEVAADAATVTGQQKVSCIKDQ